MIILYAAIIIFAFRSTPSVGDGYFWFTLDVLKFDEAFYGVLGQTSAIIAILALWLLAKQITEYSIAKTLFWIAIAGTILSLPTSACTTACTTGPSRCSASALAPSQWSTPRRPRRSRS